MGYCEMWITSCLCIVVAGSRDDLVTTKLYATSLKKNYFAVNHEENPLRDCELFITRTYSNSSWYWFSFEREMTIKLPVFRDSLFTPCNWMHTTRNWSHMQCQYSPSRRYLHVFLFLFLSCSFLLTQTNKTRRTHLGNSLYRKRRPKHKQRLEMPATTYNGTEKASQM